MGGGGRGRYYGAHLPKVVVRIATLKEFDPIDGFYTASCEPFMGRTLKNFVYTLSTEKINGTRFLTKMLKEE